MDVEAFGLVREMFEQIDQNVPRQGVEQTTRARELFSYLGKSGGGVASIGEPAFYRTPIAQLGRWSEDPWGKPTYAIDASTTRPLEYTNGLIADTAYAKLGVAGTDADRTAERSGTIKSVVYYDDDESTLHSEKFNHSGGGGPVRGEIVPFQPEADSTRNLSKSVGSVAQHLAEGEHARRHLDDIDGVLFLDGSLYPLGILYWVLLDHVGESSPAQLWERPAEIVENYIEVIDHQYARGYPVLGVVKTSTTSQLIDGLEEKLASHDVQTDAGLRPDVPWMRDHQFIADVLRDDSFDHLTYTSWFVSTEQAMSRFDSELLAPFADTLQSGNPAEYRRAFFFVRLPKSEFVLRVEAPLLFVRESEETRHEIQHKALKEIAHRRDVPESIARADRIARINNEVRESVRRLLESSQPSMDYNWDGRWSQDDTSEMEIQS